MMDDDQRRDWERDRARDRFWEEDRAKNDQRMQEDRDANLDWHIREQERQEREESSYRPTTPNTPRRGTTRGHSRGSSLTASSKPRSSAKSITNKINPLHLVVIVGAFIAVIIVAQVANGAIVSESSGTKVARSTQITAEAAHEQSDNMSRISEMLTQTASAAEHEPSSRPQMPALETRTENVPAPSSQEAPRNRSIRSDTELQSVPVNIEHVRSVLESRPYEPTAEEDPEDEPSGELNDGFAALSEEESAASMLMQKHNGNAPIHRTANGMPAMGSQPTVPSDEVPHDGVEDAAPPEKLTPPTEREEMDQLVNDLTDGHKSTHQISMATLIANWNPMYEKAQADHEMLEARIVQTERYWTLYLHDQDRLLEEAKSSPHLHRQMTDDLEHDVDMYLAWLENAIEVSNASYIAMSKLHDMNAYMHSVSNRANLYAITSSDMIRDVSPSITILLNSLDSFERQSRQISEAMSAQSGA